MKSEMTCREGVPLLTDYLEGAVGSRVRAALDRHVAGCRRCQGFVRSYVATPRILRAALPEPMPRRVGLALRRRLAGVLGRRARARSGTPPAARPSPKRR
jgi:anti-sigma factor RsiW